MPAIYVSGNEKISVTLPNDDDHEFTFGQWTDKKLAKQRTEYDRSNAGIWLTIANEDDPSCPFSFPVADRDVYDGSLTVTQNGRTFNFEVNGKFKVNVHKDIKAQIDASNQPKLESLVINGQQYSYEAPIDISIIVQSKKL